MSAHPIESLFRKQVENDPKVKNAFLLVHCVPLGVDLRLAASGQQGCEPDPLQPNYMASVGKLFTATVVAMLAEQGRLSFQDPVADHLDPELADELHVYKGKDHSGDIRVRHLLNQTSGLADNFYPLLHELLEDPDFDMTPRQAVEWAKQHLKPYAAPGQIHYTDTNYHLLGLIVERITGRPFHEVLSTMIFEPLDMRRSWMLHMSEPMEPSAQPEADFYFDSTRLNGHKGYAGIDYAGGGVVAPLAELLMFIKALVGNRLVSRATLQTMLGDRAHLNPGFDYGYGIWQLRTIPLLMPARFKCWGVLGATGAFMFYHPGLDAYVIGNFNHTAYKKKCVRFMLKVIDKLTRQAQKQPV